MKTLFIGINSKYIHPSMGIFQLIANTSHKYDYKEFTIKDKNEKIIDYIYSNSFDVLAFSVYIWNIEKIKEILSYLKEQNFNKIIYCGGPEASYSYEILMNNYNVNYITKGEGETSFNLLVDYLCNKCEITSVPNLYYKDCNSILYTFNRAEDLNTINHDYSLIGDFKNRICYIESSRGCFFNCAYCMASLEKPVRFFPIEKVKEDLLFLLNKKAKIIKFLDRSFNVNKGYMLEILKFINEHDNGYTTFQFEVVGDLLTNEECEYINTMRKGYLRFEIGIQSTNEETMKEINRHQNFEKIRKNILAIKNTVVIHTDLIAGLPLEDYNSFKKSFNETFMLLTEELQLGFLKELKGTEISIKKNKYEYIFEDYAPFEVIKNKYISNAELKEIKLVEESVDKFYNPGHFKKTFEYLFTNFKIDPFNFFNYISKWFINKNLDFKKLQFAELTQYLYQSISSYVDDYDFDLNYLFFLIKQDYLSRVNVKPKIFWTSDITREERKDIYTKISKLFNLKINDLFNYGKLEKYNNIYYLIIYPSKKEYIFIN